jgi:small nuclear ribonucleoprotein (snRNP)-like protein
MWICLVVGINDLLEVYGKVRRHQLSYVLTSYHRTPAILEGGGQCFKWLLALDVSAQIVYYGFISKGIVTEIDLSRYVGKEVILILDNNETLSGEPLFFKNHHSAYCYEVSGWQFTKTGKGLSKPQIKSIQLKNPMTGIAQQHPNINLEDFEGQRCYIKWSDGKEFIGTIKYSTTESFWYICGGHSLYYKDGTGSHSKNAPIEEIYGEGAYEITTKDTFDAPSDDVVTKATEALKDLTEEQIAKVLHALKGK